MSHDRARPDELSVSRGDREHLDRPGDGAPSYRSDDDEVDATLVASASRGDRSAFATIYTRYVRLVYGVILSRAHPADVDDLTQDVFMKALRSIHRLRDGESLGAWLCAMARNRTVDHHRGKIRRGVESLATTNTSAARDDDGARQAALEILEVIQALPDPYREPLVLRLVEQMTGPEIARRLGATHGAVRVNLHRGMKLLRERLDAEEDRP